MRGGQPGRTAQGRRIRTREVASIDRTVNLNRALWVLAEEMRKLKSWCRISAAIRHSRRAAPAR